MPGSTTQRRHLLLAAAAAGLALALAALPAHRRLLGETEAPEGLPDGAVTIEALYSQEWSEGADRVAILRGNCRIVRGDTTLRAQKVVLWRRPEDGGGGAEHLAVYLEDDVRVESPERTVRPPSAFVHLSAPAGVRVEARRRVQGEPADEDPLYARARDRSRQGRNRGLRPTQLVVPGDEPPPVLQALPAPPRMGGFRRLRTFPRSAIPYNVESFVSEATIPPEQVTILTGGVTIIIDGVADLGTVDLAADRMVIWTRARTGEGFEAEQIQSRDEPLQIYLEGNIVVRQGEYVARASHAVYDARDDRGLILNAELKTPLPDFDADLRVRAERVRQLGQDTYFASNAWVTTSQFGAPGYRVEASDVFVEPRLREPFFQQVFGVPPFAGAPVEQVPWVTSFNNTFYVEDVPVFFLPRLSAPADEPAIPLRGLQVRRDRIFGFQVRSAWNLFMLLGIDQPHGTDWDLLADYFSERGPAVGTSGRYRGTDLFGLPGPFHGEGLAYFVHDRGEDRLGRDRLAVPPADENRYRLLARHRQLVPYNIELTAELGLISDRNFLEQYFEREFNRDKDNETLLYAKQQFNTAAWTLFVRPQLNPFDTTTEWLPRGDLYVLSAPLLGGALTWTSRTAAGYAQLRPGDPPDPRFEVFTPLDFVTEAEGAVLLTRHELNAPFSLGPLNVAPYVFGEAAYWGEGFDNESVQRYVGNAGVRGNVMAWRTFPFVQSDVFNLNGLAHKMLFEADYSLTASTEDLGNIPQYHEFDDDAQERFRQRLVVNTFRGALLPQFDPRFYAVRMGAGRTVTVPYHELIDDLHVLRFAWRHRLQTKVGPPDRLRIRDWMSLDLGASFFPQSERDNFGEDFGLLTAQYAWEIGARTRVLASAMYDLFDDAQQLWSIGILSQRRERGSVYLGVRQVKAFRLDSRIVTASYSYNMSPKWVSTFGTAVDIDDPVNFGQSFTLTRLGADFNIHFGANINRRRDDVGIAVGIEPRFLPFGGPMQMGPMAGAQPGMAPGRRR